ncbi:hypothetical protein JS530_03745 [Bifidobacterium sp. LC6]|uniref:Uncharacterized protein n=1 Tax=Bifidobacterium colobi TaxID=2809026 RepID=A0ABS5UV57_9BIFI|nr:hypothetical protein [Bifidobacterium colobi]MBT1174626.1 hypothetical protein [Bifidobacterium colobi]
MASALHANPGEREILSTRAWVQGEGTWGTNKLCQVLLTDKNLIVGVEGFLGGIKEMRTYPVSQIIVVNGNAQVRATSEGAAEIDTKQGHLSLHMESRNEAKKFADMLRQLVTTGTVDTSKDEAGFLADMAGQLGGTLKDTFGSFTKELGIGGQLGNKQVSITCSGCGATLNGTKGQTVQCPYCDGMRQL